MEPTKPATSRAATPVARRSASAQQLASGDAAIGGDSVRKSHYASVRRSLRAQRRRHGSLCSCRPPRARCSPCSPRKRRRRAAKISTPLEFRAALPRSRGVCALRDSTRRLRTGALGCRAASPARPARAAGRRARWPRSRTTSALPLHVGRGYAAVARACARRTPCGALPGRPRTFGTSAGVRSRRDAARRFRSAAPRRATRGNTAAPGAARPAAARRASLRCDLGTAEDFHVQAIRSPRSRAAQLRLPLQGGAHRRLRRRQVQPAVSLHAQRVLPRVQVHDWRGVRYAQHSGTTQTAWTRAARLRRRSGVAHTDERTRLSAPRPAGRREDHQGANLGHRWPGAVRRGGA